MFVSARMTPSSNASCAGSRPSPRGAGSVPAFAAVGLDAFCNALREGMEPLQSDGVGIRVASELGWITAEVDSR
jgi:hypothetical protein